MQQFRKILCVVDPLAKRHVAVRRAVGLAERNHAELKLVDVVDTTTGWLGLMIRSHAELLEQERRVRLQAVSREHARGRGEIKTEVLHGRPALEVVKEVMRGGFDLVIKDARGIPSQKTLLVGSVEMRLLRNCPCPVWLTMPEQPLPYARILAAIDPLADDEIQKSLNRSILELASSLTQFDAGELHIVAAWNTPGEELLIGRISEDRLAAYVEQTKLTARQNLDELITQIQPRILPQQLHFGKGEASSLILRTAREMSVDAIVLGTVARNLTSLLMGNTADAVLRQVNCSVLTVKPMGFVAPLGKTQAD